MKNDPRIKEVELLTSVSSRRSERYYVAVLWGTKEDYEAALHKDDHWWANNVIRGLRRIGARIQGILDNSEQLPANLVIVQ